jgi:hypothetical protein
MPKYKVFFQLYGNKMCKEVDAMDRYEAENMIRDELVIDETRKMDDEPEVKPTINSTNDAVDMLNGLFGRFSK